MVLSQSNPQDKVAFWHPIVGQGFLPSNFGEYVGTVQMDLLRWRPEFIVLHNTASPTFAQWHEVPGHERMANLEHYYRDQLKWSGGPHLFVADDLIWVFTPLAVPGVHSPSWNKVSWGIEMVGNYAVEPLSNAVKGNTVIAITALTKKCDLDPTRMKLHHEDPLTTHRNCPGPNVDKAEIISLVEAQL
jgi:hypothetical protein